MKKISLAAVARKERGRKVNSGRKSGRIPAVIYGKNVTPESLWINNLELCRLLGKSSESVIIDLSIDGKGGRNVIIHELQKNPVNDQFIHVDFYQVRMDEKIKAAIQLEFINESIAVKELGGVLVKNLDKIEVECLPADLPSHIEVDISKIKTFDEHVFVKDLEVGEKVEIKIDPETVVALVTPPRTEEELSELSEKVEEDVTKVEGVVKEESAAEEKIKQQ